MTAKTMMVAGTAAVLLLATGACSKKVGGQVVAVVNGQEITQQELNGELNGATIPPTADRKAVMAQLLGQVVDRKLLVGKAKKEGLDQSPTYLAQVQKAQDVILINLLAEKTMKGQPLPDAAAADKFMAENGSLFGGRKRYQLDQIAFPQTADPVVVKKLQAAKSMEEIEAALKAAGIVYQSGKGALDTGSIPPDAAKHIAALPAGMPFLVPQNGQVVASVIRSSEVVPVPNEQGKAGAIGLLRRQAVDQAMRKQLDAERAAAKIQYEQGFAPPAKPAAGTTPPAS